MLRFAAATHEPRGINIARTRPFQTLQRLYVRQRFMKVRVLRVPPSRALEGIDLRPYKLQEGSVYELDPRVAKVLLEWKYAERLMSAAPRRKSKQ